ncbi:TPA: hypothetical protein L3V69_003073 [Vibrio parahaemolyticus]|uniref:hypothetical protein n=1 Tax=Vibrio parahaemolyticus TaxID=670 RepID=UPI0022B5624C|nr:hypothetical protein [Vibrio parahaemolyticus]ELB1989264.1 hypothetical protein [Vibrio parahaemolyticus]ELB2083759.1 hypothetical protein [Vibrio parahaemolyticus]MCZ6311142.1 hypothetical protein [Vibrio parahaemolyticus]HBN6178858.1 hypothetical protein [Vibrio parahaemolyticus]HBN6318035.1 hypothetical protein [Vibrio parahaemolyticus]
MKISFHFDADDTSLGSYYGLPTRKALMGAILSSRTLDLNSKVFQGDLLLHQMAMDVEVISKYESIHSSNSERYIQLINGLLNPDSHIWHSITERTIDRFVTNNVWVISFESISFSDAVAIDTELKKVGFYLGAIEVDETNPIHWEAYAYSLVAHYRIIGRNINFFLRDMAESSEHEGDIQELKSFGFSEVGFEKLNGKFSFFDKYNNFEHARRIAELKSALGDSLASLADQVICRLSDPAPEIGSKLWSALRTYNNAEVNEDYAQVSASCRRIIEYVADQLFPPQENSVKGRKVGKGHYKNRLLAFADAERSSSTNIELIAVSIESLAEQLDKLTSLNNKGVHAEVFKHEAKRCLLRTIMILDDIISLKSGPFIVNV